MLTSYLQMCEIMHQYHIVRFALQSHQHTFPQALDLAECMPLFSKLIYQCWSIWHGICKQLSFLDLRSNISEDSQYDQYQVGITQWYCCENLRNNIIHSCHFWTTWYTQHKPCSITMFRLTITCIPCHNTFDRWLNNIYLTKTAVAMV